MNAITTTPEQISAQTLEVVLGTGDLSKLTTQQRVEFYAKTCASLGLNPLTRPFRFLSFQGSTVMYATRDCSDQLRNLREISVQIMDKMIDGDLFIVTARASNKAGRQDEDIGAVSMNGLKGEARANAMMKAMTKAKRRVTLSICGLGFLDETEVATLEGAMTYDAEAAAPPAATIVHREEPAKQPRHEPQEAAPRRPYADYLRDKLAACTTPHEVAALRVDDERIGKVLGNGNKPLIDMTEEWMAARVESMMPAEHLDAETVPDVADTDLGEMLA